MKNNLAIVNLKALGVRSVDQLPVNSAPGDVQVALVRTIVRIRTAIAGVQCQAVTF